MREVFMRGEGQNQHIKDVLAHFERNHLALMKRLGKSE